MSQYGVIPMRVCHILLGRPWLYDRSVKHDGRENTYTFELNGKRTTWRPIKEIPQPKKPAKKEVVKPPANVLSMRRLEAESKETGVICAMIALLVEVAKEHEVELPEQVQASGVRRSEATKGRA